jgi:hypothetical protein
MPTETKIVGMRTLRAERAKAQDFNTLKEVADYIGLPEKILADMVLKAFVEMVSEDKQLILPIMLDQVPLSE